VQRIRDDQAQVGHSVARRSRDWVMSCDIMCDPHLTHGGDEKHGFPGLASNPVATVC
jgi:hypothetical protein